MPKRSLEDSSTPKRGDVTGRTDLQDELLRLMGKDKKKKDLLHHHHCTAHFYCAKSGFPWGTCPKPHTAASHKSVVEASQTTHQCTLDQSQITLYIHSMGHMNTIVGLVA